MHNLLPFELLHKELLPTLEHTGLVRLSQSSKTWRAALSPSDAAIDEIWQTLHKRRWTTSATTPTAGSWYNDYKRRHLLDATVLDWVARVDSGEGGTVEDDPAWRDLILGGLDIVDALRSIATRGDNSRGDIFHGTNAEIAQFALVAINRIHAVKMWRDLMLSKSEDGTSTCQGPHNIEDGAVALARLYADPDRVLEMSSLEEIEANINTRLDHMSDSLCEYLDDHFPTTSANSKVESKTSTGTTTSSLSPSTYANRDILESMQKIFSNDDECGLGFTGNENDYYNFKNSCLDQVLEKKTGIPITLSIIYAAIVRRATDLVLDPVGLPGHFILATPQVDGEERMFIDAFKGGKILGLQQVKDIVASYGLDWDDSYVRPIPLQDVWSRMLRNLYAIHGKGQVLGALLLDITTLPLPVRTMLLRDDGGAEEHGFFHRNMFKICRSIEPEYLSRLNSDIEIVRFVDVDYEDCRTPIPKGEMSAPLRVILQAFSRGI